MASYYTHYRCALRAANDLSERGRDLVDGRREIFLAGAQGPDLLFYIFGKYRGTAGRVHACAVYEQFCSLARLCASSGSADFAAYCLGYVSHYCVDREIHPLMTHDAANYMRRFFKPDLYPSLHMMQESAIDRILFLRDRGDGTRFHAKEVLPFTDASRAATAACLAEVCKAIGRELPFDKLYAAQKRMAAYQSVFDNLFSPACLVVKAAGALIGKPNYIYGFVTPPLDRGIDYMNAERRPYPSVVGEDDSTPLDLSVDSVLEKAHERTLDLAAKFLAAIDGQPLSPSDFEISFSGRRTLAPHEFFDGADD